MDFKNQRKAYLLRSVQKRPYEEIAGEVLNMQGEHPHWTTVRDVCQGFSVRKGCRPYKYHKCGRKPWKMTSDVQKFVLRKLLADRMKKVVTSSSLAADVAKEKGVVLEASSIRKLLKAKGYKWMPRSQKRKYSKEEREVRERFARAVLRLSKESLRLKMAMSLDGVVLSMPPVAEIERFNYCWGGFGHMWRKASEANSPPLAGADAYEKQVPLSRAIPLWGGCSEDGFEVVLWHERKKVDNETWSTAVREGKLTDALRKINPQRRRGPWTVLCDNESFLRHRRSMVAYALKNVDLWEVPPKSPDLNPIEMFWAWARRELRLRDLEDLRKKRPPLGKTAYRVRVKTLFRSQKAQTVAKQCAMKMRSKCKAVLNNAGAAINS